MLLWSAQQEPGAPRALLMNPPGKILLGVPPGANPSSAFVYPLVNIQKSMEIAIEIVDLPINSMVDFSIVMSVRLPYRVTFFSNQRIFHTPRGHVPRDQSGAHDKPTGWFRFTVP